MSHPLPCPSCQKPIRVGYQTQPGTGSLTYFVWCHRPNCDGVRGEGSSLSAALADLDKNFKKRKKENQK